MSGSNVVSAKNEAFTKKVFSGLFYAMSSFGVTVMDNVIMTMYTFPSYQVLRLGQIAATIIVLWIGRRMQLTQFPPINRWVARIMSPLAVLYLANMATSLVASEKLNLPMFTVSRRVVILMTMILEKIFLGVQPSCLGQTSVMIMLVGAIITAVDHATFSRTGSYILVLLNNACSAANGVYLKKILDSKELGLCGLMFYDALLMTIPAFIATCLSDDFSNLAEFINWKNPYLICHILMSFAMGFILSYSVMLCTQYNSALTTTVIGSIISILLTYLELATKADYKITGLNFAGLNISLLGGLTFTIVTFKGNPAVAGTLVSNAA